MKKILFLFAFIFLIFISTQSASAANCSTTINGGGVGTDTSHECVPMTGFAWGADNTNGQYGGIGWVSFSDSRTTKKYNVDFDRNDLSLHGYAYSENYGYIRFGGFTDGTDDFPGGSACENATEGDNECNAHLVQNTNGGYELVGYARLCFVYQNNCSGALKSDLGGYDGWIGFKGSGFGVTYATGPNLFKDFAWGGGNSSSSDSNYAQGIGWVKMDPSGGGVSCVVANDSMDCISDNQKPTIELTADIMNPRYNEDVTLTWTISDTNSCDTVTIWNDKNNSNWQNGNPAIITFPTDLTGQQPVGKITQNTTFNLSCTVNTGNGDETGTDSVTVVPKTFTPIVTLSAIDPIDSDDTIIYGGDVELNYTVTNIPYGCNAEFFNRNISTTIPFDTRTISSNGTETDLISDTITVPNVTTDPTTTWEFRCTDTNDTTNPFPTGIATDTTIVDVPSPIITFSVTDIDTSSTTIIPCTNSGVEITYSVDPNTIYPGSCVVSSGTGYYTDSFWKPYNSSDPTSFQIIEDGSTHTKTQTSGSVSQTGSLLYDLKCLQVNQAAYWHVAKVLTHSCTGGSLSVSVNKTCYELGETVYATYSGTGLQANTCQKGFNSSQSSFSHTSTLNGQDAIGASFFGIGTGYNYTVNSCKEADYPSNPSLSKTSVNFEVKALGDCPPPTCTDKCDPQCSNYNPLRCPNGPKFKEQ